METVGDFFRAMPDVFSALWSFGDEWYGVAVTVASAALIGLLLLLTSRLRAEHSWLSATFGGMAIAIGFWWGFGILPSAWVFFVDGSRDLLEGVVIPSALPMMDNFYEVFRDLVVLGLTGVGTVAFVLIAMWLQKRYPKALAEGEEPRPQSGGYR